MISIRNLFVPAWKRMSSRYWNIMAAMYIPLIVLMVGVGVFCGLAFMLYKISDGGLIVFSILLGILAFVWMVALGVVASVTGYCAVLVPHKEPFKVYLVKALNAFGPAVWIGALQMFVVYGASMLFGIPGLFLGLATMFAMPIFLLHGTKGFGALIRSKDLVKGKWWRLLGRMLLVGIVLYIPMLPFAGLTGSENTWIAVPALILVYVYEFLFFSPYIMCFYAEQYFWLEKEKGGVPEIKNLESRRIRYIIMAVAGWALFFVIAIGSAVMSIKQLVQTQNEIIYGQEIEGDFDPYLYYPDGLDEAVE